MRYVWVLLLIGGIAGLVLGQAAPSTAPQASPPGDDSGISGPGQPFVEDAPVFVRRSKSDCSAIKAGLIPSITPLLDLHIRDVAISVGGDGQYYMTGSTGADIWDHNDGIELWRSRDLKTWSYLGLVWSFEKDATWQKEWRTHRNRPVRAIWGPELKFIKGNYYLTYSMPPGDRGILKSTTRKPEGPYVNALAEDGRFPGDIGASLFLDDDGKIYLVYGGGWIALLKDDLSGLAGEPKKPELLDPDKDPAHHNQQCAIRRDCMDIGRENPFLFKHDGRYYLIIADTYDGRYSGMVAFADTIYGPYRQRHEGIPCGGGTSIFKDKQGNLFATLFGNDNQAPWREMPAILRINFDKDGKLQVAGEPGK